MKPGRKLDTLVAEKVMGWKIIDRVKMGWGRGPVVWDTGQDPEDEHSSPTYQDFRPSERITDAWLVVEKLGIENYPFILTQDRYSGVYSGGKWLASFNIFMRDYDDGPLSDDIQASMYWGNSHRISAGETAAHAICLAALKAVDILVDQETLEHTKES